MKTASHKGFTIIEIAASIAVFSLIMLLSGALYTLAQRSYRQGVERAEIIQNARVSLDRMARELRQAIKIITVLPPTNNDPLNPPAGEILFQDGHNPESITYLKYYLDGQNLMRKHLSYYFPEEPSNYVLYGSRDQNGDSPLEASLEDRIIGEYFQNISFWGEEKLINISVALEKNSKQFQAATRIHKRN